MQECVPKIFPENLSECLFCRFSQSSECLIPALLLNSFQAVLSIPVEPGATGTP